MAEKNQLFHENTKLSIQISKNNDRIENLDFKILRLKSDYPHLVNDMKSARLLKVIKKDWKTAIREILIDCSKALKFDEIVSKVGDTILAEGYTKQAVRNSIRPIIYSMVERGELTKLKVGYNLNEYSLLG